MTKKSVEIFMCLAIILSTISLISDCKKQESTDIITDYWHVAFEKSMLSVDAHIDGNTDQYNQFTSDSDSILKKIKDLEDTRQIYTNIVYFSGIISLISIILAFLMVLMIGEQPA